MTWSMSVIILLEMIAPKKWDTQRMEQSPHECVYAMRSRARLRVYFEIVYNEQCSLNIQIVWQHSNCMYVLNFAINEKIYHEEA